MIFSKNECTDVRVFKLLNMGKLCKNYEKLDFDDRFLVIRLFTGKIGLNILRNLKNLEKKNFLKPHCGSLGKFSLEILAHLRRTNNLKASSIFSYFTFVSTSNS